MKSVISINICNLLRHCMLYESSEINMQYISDDLKLITSGQFKLLGHRSVSRKVFLVSKSFPLCSLPNSSPPVLLLYIKFFTTLSLAVYSRNSQQPDPLWQETEDCNDNIIGWQSSRLARVQEASVSHLSSREGHSMERRVPLLQFILSVMEVCWKEPSPLIVT